MEWLETIKSVEEVNEIFEAWVNEDCVGEPCEDHAKEFIRYQLDIDKNYLENNFKFIMAKRFKRFDLWINTKSGVRECFRKSENPNKIEEVEENEQTL